MAQKNVASAKDRSNGLTENRKSLGEILHNNAETPDVYHPVRRRPLEEVLKSDKGLEPGEVREIVNRVLDKGRDSTGIDNICSIAECIADPHGEHGGESIGTLGWAVSYMASKRAYEALSGVMEYDNGYVEEDWFRWTNIQFCKALLKESSNDPDIRAMLSIRYGDFIAGIDTGDKKEINDALNGETVRTVIKQGLKAVNKAWGIRQPVDEYISEMRREADRFERLITGPLKRVHWSRFPLWRKFNGTDGVAK